MSRVFRLISRRTQPLVTVLVCGMSLMMPACTNTTASTSGSQAGSPSQPEVKLTLVSFAVTKAAHDAIIPKFVAKWQQEHNQKVVFEQSYGGSGSQTRAVIDGLEADVVHLALALDVNKLEEAKLIEPNWAAEAPNNSIASQSVAVLVTREGNPKNIQSWADLTRNDVKFITANPKTSGGARWNFLALWGSVTQTGGDDSQAQSFVTQAFRNVPILPKDAREASDVFFKQGQGDVLINYENEALLAAQQGEKLPFVVPKVNIAIENPVAVVDQNVDKHGTRAVAEAFVQYLYSPAAQREFARYGFRPVERTVVQETASQFPQVNTLFNVKDLGGWDKVQQQFFADGALFDQLQSTQGR